MLRLTITQQPVVVKIRWSITRYLVVTYFSVFKLWFTLRVSASAAAPESSILFHSRLQTDCRSGYLLVANLTIVSLTVPLIIQMQYRKVGEGLE